MQGEGCCGDGQPDGPAFGETCDLGTLNCTTDRLPCDSGCTASCHQVGRCAGNGAQCLVNEDCAAGETCCGNGVVDAGETCDDGNTVDGDACPSSCRVESCTPLTTTVATSVRYTGPPGVTIAGLGIFVDYPEGKAAFPTVTVGFGVGNSTNDLGYGFTAEPLKLTGLPNPVLRATYKNCEGASAPVAADFSCTVTDASDDLGNIVDPSAVTCSVTIP
jgi:cysteine-rich repeat protein